MKPLISTTHMQSTQVLELKKARRTNIGAICDVSERVSTNQVLMKANGSGTGQAGKQVAKHV
jgi:hypothetical protein